MPVPAGHPAGAVAGGLVPRSARQRAKPGVSEEPYLRSRQHIGTLNPGITQKIARKSPHWPGMVPVFVTLPGLCFGGAALQHSVRRVHHQPEIEQMTTVADGTPFYEAAGLSFTTPTESCRKLPAALPREETIVT